MDSIDVYILIRAVVLMMLIKIEYENTCSQEVFVRRIYLSVGVGRETEKDLLWIYCRNDINPL